MKDTPVLHASRIFGQLVSSRDCSIHQPRAEKAESSLGHRWHLTRLSCVSKLPRREWIVKALDTDLRYPLFLYHPASLSRMFSLNPISFRRVMRKMRKMENRLRRNEKRDTDQYPFASRPCSLHASVIPTLLSTQNLLQDRPI